MTPTHSNFNSKLYLELRKKHFPPRRRLFESGTGHHDTTYRQKLRFADNDLIRLIIAHGGPKAAEKMMNVEKRYPKRLYFCTKPVGDDRILKALESTYDVPLFQLENAPLPAFINRKDAPDERILGALWLILKPKDVEEEAKVENRYLQYKANGLIPDKFHSDQRIVRLILALGGDCVCERYLSLKESHAFDSYRNTDQSNRVMRSFMALWGMTEVPEFHPTWGHVIMSAFE